MGDILYRSEDHLFSYRVAGICIREGQVLLQSLEGEPGYAFPGGHVSFGETSGETLVREFMEEAALNVRVGPLKWVAENFFPWDGKPCHQICLYYLVELIDPAIPMTGSFPVKEHLDGRILDLQYHWIPLAEIPELLIYPGQAKGYLKLLDEGVRHFVFRE